MTAADVLRDGFALTHRRLGLVFLDILWKYVWMAATAALLLAVVGWFGNQIGSIEWQGSEVPGLNGLAAAALLKQFWDEHAGEMLLAVIGVVVLSALLSIVLEAFCRSRILAGLRSSTPALRGEHRCFKTYLVSNVAKSIILTAAAFTLGLITFGQYFTTPLSDWPGLWPETQNAIIISLVTFLGLVFFLTIFDTLARSDATDLFGTDLIRVSGVIGTLLMFESLIDASIAILVVTGFLNVGTAAEGVAMLGFAAAGVLLQSLLHSYLLLVRFSAVGIMRHNVVDI